MYLDVCSLSGGLKSLAGLLDCLFGYADNFSGYRNCPSGCEDSLYCCYFVNLSDLGEGRGVSEEISFANLILVFLNNSAIPYLVEEFR